MRRISRKYRIFQKYSWVGIPLASTKCARFHCYYGLQGTVYANLHDSEVSCSHFCQAITARLVSTRISIHYETPTSFLAFRLIWLVENAVSLRPNMPKKGHYYTPNADQLWMSPDNNYLGFDLTKPRTWSKHYTMLTIHPCYIKRTFNFFFFWTSLGDVSR